jgi:hypothetical protein
MYIHIYIYLYIPYVATVMLLGYYLNLSPLLER